MGQEHGIGRKKHEGAEEELNTRKEGWRVMLKGNRDLTVSSTMLRRG